MRVPVLPVLLVLPAVAKGEAVLLPELEVSAVPARATVVRPEWVRRLSTCVKGWRATLHRRMTA